MREEIDLLCGTDVALWFLGDAVRTRVTEIDGDMRLRGWLTWQGDSTDCPTPRYMANVDSHLFVR